MSKTKLSAINIGCSLLDQAFAFILPLLTTPGISELQVKRKLNRFLITKGAQGFAFPTIVAFGNHSASPHHQPTNRSLTFPNIILIDIGIKISGYCSDATRTFFVGKPKSSWIKSYQAVLIAQQKALAAKPPLTGSSLDAIARDYFKTRKLDRYFIHSLGHGLGKKIHDLPQINPKANNIVKPGHVITIEPGLYYKNRFGIRIEDTALATSSGFTTLTHFPKKLKSVTID